MIRNQPFFLQKYLVIRKLIAAISMAALFAGTLTAGLQAQSMKRRESNSGAKLSQDQRILHVLNRLGFGARSGDLERVRAIGVDKYLEQQLFPEKIDDSASEAKLQNLTTLRLTTAELYEKYPQPNQLLKQLQRRDALPADLAAARENRVNGANKANDPNQQKPGAAMAEEMNGSTTAASPPGWWQTRPKGVWP